MGWLTCQNVEQFVEAGGVSVGLQLNQVFLRVTGEKAWASGCDRFVPNASRGAKVRQVRGGHTAPFVHPWWKMNSSNLPVHVEHRAKPDRTHSYRRLGTSCPGLHCRTSWSLRRVAPARGRKTWFPVEDKKPKRQCRPAAYHAPA